MITRRLEIFSLALTALLAARCSAHGGHNEAPKFPTTSPARTDTEVTREYVGQIRAIQHIELRALERGYLQDIFVDEGQVVKKGKLMFQVAPTIYQAELHKAQAEAGFAEIEYANTKKLAEGHVVSPNELALSQAKLDKAKAEAELAKAHLTFTEIRAPFDGIMNRLLVRKGSLLDEGELLSTLSDNSKMWVYFNVNEAEYLDYKSHQDGADTSEVELIMANAEPFEQHGRIETIEGEFNNDTGTIAFRATFENPKGLLRHGQTGKVRMKSALKNALVIPQKSTFDILDKKFVFVVGEDSVVHAQQIVIAKELPQVYVVASGITEKDKILLEGLRKVKDGDQVSTSYLESQAVLSHLEAPAN